MFRMHRERGSGGERFSVAGASVSETQDKKTLTLALSQGERGWSREEATKNVQSASGCIKNWYELRVGVSRCYSEVLLRQRIAEMPLLVVDEARTSKSCIKNGPFGGGHGDPKRPPIPSPGAPSVVAVPRWSPAFRRNRDRLKPGLQR